MISKLRLGFMCNCEQVVQYSQISVGKIPFPLAILFAPVDLRASIAAMSEQLVFADALPTLRHIFLTHQHSDHNADYGNLIWLAWAAGLSTRVDT